MILTDITTPAEVRAVLGVSAAELEDGVLLGHTFLVRLTEDLREIHAQILIDFQAAKAKDSLSDDEQRFVDLVQAYSEYNVARQCLASLDMFAPERITDGKAERQLTTDPYAQLRKDVPQVLGMLRVKLRSAYAKVNTDAPAPTAIERLLVLAATPSLNPITG